MGWFGDICRNIGLMVHNIKHPDPNAAHRKVIKKKVEETTEGNLTLRRTTIEEVEIKPDTAQDKND